MRRDVSRASELECAVRGLLLVVALVSFRVGRYRLRASIRVAVAKGGSVIPSVMCEACGGRLLGRFKTVAVAMRVAGMLGWQTPKLYGMRQLAFPGWGDFPIPAICPQCRGKGPQ
jgi:hypothetical protein